MPERLWLIKTVIKESDIDFHKGLVLSHIPSDNYICIMPTLNGAAAIDWVKKLLYPETSYDEIETIIRDIPIGSRGADLSSLSSR